MTRKALNFLYIFFGLLLVSHYFDYSSWDTTKGPLLIQIYVLFTYTYVVLKLNTINKYYDNNYKIVIWMLTSGVLTIASSTVAGIGTFSMQRGLLLIISMIPIFFFLKARKIEKREIINAFTVYLIITFTIQIYQQINFSNPLFGLQWTDNGETFTGYQRNDLFRFSIGISTLGEFCLCYYWSKLCKKASLWFVLLFIVASVSVYLYLTRQYMIAVLLTVFLSLFFVKDKKVKKWGFLGITVLTTVLFMNYDLIFKNIVALSDTDSYSTDIRKVAYSFILSHVFDNPIMWLTGHGHTYQEASWTNKGLYTADIGFVGQMYLQGLLWVIIYFYTIYVLLWKKKDKLPLYLKLFTFCTFIHSPMVFPYSALASSFVWMVFLYLCSLEEKKIHNEKQHKN